MNPLGQIVILPDVEAEGIAILNQYLPQCGEANLHVGTNVPNPRPDEFIRLIRGGGLRETLITEQAWLITEAWAQTEKRASFLLSLCRAIFTAQDDTFFGVLEVSGPSNLPDPSTSQVRYTQTLGIRATGHVVDP